MRYLITLSVEGLAALSATTSAALNFFDAHPDYAGKYEVSAPEQQEVS